MEILIFVGTIILLAIIFIFVVFNPAIDIIVVNNKRYHILWYSTSNGRNYIILWQL